MHLERPDRGDAERWYCNRGLEQLSLQQPDWVFERLVIKAWSAYARSACRHTDDHFCQRYMSTLCLMFTLGFLPAGSQMTREETLGGSH